MIFYVNKELKIKKLIVIYIFLLQTFTIHACPVGTQGFHPLNYPNQETLTLMSYDRAPFVNSKTSREVYDFIISKIEDIYTPIIKSLGFNLMIESDWFSTDINAYADVNGMNKEVYFSGGYARVLTPGAFLKVACHEMGHHLGGYPMKDNDITWVSVEGEADYFASLYCVRRVLAEDLDNTININAGNLLPNSIKNSCRAQFKKQKDIEICFKNIQASVELSEFYLDYLIKRNLLEILNGVTKIDLLNLPNYQVEVTNEFHTDPQCRLMTHYQASLCNFSELSNYDYISSQNEAKGVCHKLNGDLIGARPGCWFKGEN